MQSVSRSSLKQSSHFYLVPTQDMSLGGTSKKNSTDSLKLEQRQAQSGRSSSTSWAEERETKIDKEEAHRVQMGPVCHSEVEHYHPTKPNQTLNPTLQIERQAQDQTVKAGL